MATGLIRQPCSTGTAKSCTTTDVTVPDFTWNRIGSQLRHSREDPSGEEAETGEEIRRLRRRARGPSQYICSRKAESHDKAVRFEDAAQNSDVRKVQGGSPVISGTFQELLRSLPSSFDAEREEERKQRDTYGRNSR